MDIYTKTEQLQERQCWIEAVQLLVTGQNSQKIPCEPGHLGCLEAAVECLPAHSQKYRESFRAPSRCLCDTHSSYHRLHIFVWFGVLKLKISFSIALLGRRFAILWDTNRYSAALKSVASVVLSFVTRAVELKKMGNIFSSNFRTSPTMMDGI